MKTTATLVTLAATFTLSACHLTPPPAPYWPDGPPAVDPYTTTGVPDTTYAPPDPASYTTVPVTDPPTPPTHQPAESCYDTGPNISDVVIVPCAP